MASGELRVKREDPSPVTRHSSPPHESRVAVVDLGLRPYGPVLELQRGLAAARIDGRLQRDVLLLVEHPPVVTLGRSSKERHLLASPELLASRGVELFEVERGGDVTFHGPGQLVGYPILDLGGHRRDLHWYLRQVEEVLIQALATWGLSGTRRTGYTGVWTTGKANDPPYGEQLRPGPREPEEPQAAIEAQKADEPGLRPANRPMERKIASIGVHAKQWVTWHGFALNVSTDLSFFDLIVPCGITGVEMTSIERETGTRVGLPEATQAVVRAFEAVFEVLVEPAQADALLESAGTP